MLIHPRHNPAVTARASDCFAYIAQAIGAETLQGNTASRAAAAAAKIAQAAGLDPNQLLATLPPETQGMVRGMFA